MSGLLTPRGGGGGGGVGSRAVGHRDDVEGTQAHGKFFQRRLAIYDRVYGQIQFPPVIRLFIDSPEMQRLRDLKQLGNGHYVYPSATHTRFEHSLGVSHLAMTFLRQILTNGEEEPGQGENVQEILAHRGPADVQKEVWCVGIAGLCHDLGHGPLSHVFEKYVNTVRAREGKGMWSHEETSISMLRAIWASNETGLSHYGLGSEDLAFVELLITGLKPTDPWPSNVGRGEEMRFMTEIIANKRNGLDVDKIDYLQRDSLCCFGFPALVSLERLFQGACVMRDRAGQTQICYQKKLAITVGEVFQARTRMHKIVYQHRVTCVMDKMATDAFLLADSHFRISHGGLTYRLSESVDVPGAYVQTGDWVLNAILRSHDKSLAAAREVLSLTQSRDIYTTIGTFFSRDDTKFSTMAFIRRVEAVELRGRLMQWSSDHPNLPAVDQIQTNITKVSGDMKLKDPMEAIGFFNPRDGPKATPFLFTKEEDSKSPPSPGADSDAKQMFIVICRMPLTVADLNALSKAFGHIKDYTTGEVISEVQDRSLSPGVLLRRSGSHTDPQALLSQQTPPFPSPTEYMKRRREEVEGEPNNSGRHSGSRGRPERVSRRLATTEVAESGGDLFLSPMPVSAAGHAPRRQGPPHGASQQHHRRAPEDREVEPPPHVLLQQHGRSTSRGNGQRKEGAPREGSEGATQHLNNIEDDVELLIKPLSQLENSRSNEEEPDIHL